MAQIVINIPDAALPRVLEAYAQTFGYRPEMGVTKAAFTRSAIISGVKTVITSYEAGKAADLVRQQIINEVESQAIVT